MANLDCFAFLTGFGMVYGIILIASASVYCVQLDRVYDHQCTLSTSDNDGQLCHHYLMWRNYSIVAMFVGAVTLFYALLSICLKFEDGILIEEQCGAFLTFGMVMCYVMITVTFAELIKSGASGGDERVTAAAIATVVLSGVGVCSPCLIFIRPLLICLSEYSII